MYQSIVYLPSSNDNNNLPNGWSLARCIMYLKQSSSLPEKQVLLNNYNYTGLMQIMMNKNGDFKLKQ
jgi:hypothetical protein